MSPATTFLSLPRMSRARKRFALGYLLFVLILVIIYHIPWERPNRSAGGEWDTYSPWLGPAPAGLEMQMTRDEDNPSIFYIFTYDPAPETDRIITETFELRPSGQPLPAAWGMEAAPGATLYRPQHRSICMLAGNNEWGYVVQDMLLTRLSNGRSLFTFRHTNIPDYLADACYHPTFAPSPESQASIACTLLLALVYFLFWFLPVPLGFLLLFPSFTLQTKLHHVLWYASIIVPQILLLIWAHLIIHDPAIVGAWAIFMLGTPLLLLGARLLLPLGKRIAQSPV